MSARTSTSLSPRRGPSTSLRANGGFTLLEVVIALAILGLALMGIFSINSGAVANHVYTKRLTVASLLARSKMTDIEQELFDKGFQNDDDEMDGDFSDEGWPTYHWRAKIIVPKTDDVPPEQLVSAIFNIPLAGGAGDPMAALFGLGMEKAQEKGIAGGGGAAGAMAAMGPLAGFANQQLTQMIQEINKSVREVHLTVSWKDGKNTESIDIVTHVVSSGQGSDRNGLVGPGGNANAPPPGTTQWMNPRTQQIVPNPIPCRNNPQAMCDPMDQITQLIPAPLQQAGQGGFNQNLGGALQNIGANRGIMGGRGNIFNPRGTKPGLTEGE